MKLLDKTLIKEKPAADGSRDSLIYVGIALTVILFNLIAIFGLDILLHDDPAHYTEVLNGQFPWYALEYRLIHPFTEWIGWNIMTYSPDLARGLYTMLLMVPISCCFYYLCRHKFGFSRMTAFTAAVLPNILPMQWSIPAGINISYVVWGLPLIIISLILGLHYLEKSTPQNWARLAGAGLCYLIATQIMEHALFVLPAMILAFCGYKKFAKKTIFLVLTFIIIGISIFCKMAVHPRKAMQLMPFDVIIDRIGIYFTWALPVSGIAPLYATIFFPGIIFIGFLLYFKQSEEPSNTYSIFSHFSVKAHHCLVYGFFLCWMVSTISPSIFLSIPYSPRYSYLSMFGAQAIFIFSIFVILKKLFSGKPQIGIAIFIGIILLSGVSRYFTLKEKYTPRNTAFAIVQQDLNKMQLPPHSQIVITGLAGIPGGWERSSGYLQFALKRKDVNGLVGQVHSGEYYNFDNHFDSQVRGWDERYVMTGLAMNQPVFLFRMDKKTGQLQQLEYALQWRSEEMNAPWTILRVDKTTGSLFPFVSGTGMREYESAILKLQKKGIQQSDILWGGPPTEEEQKRLAVK